MSARSLTPKIFRDCGRPQGATPADIAEFIMRRGGMTMGWTGSFDKLKALARGAIEIEMALFNSPP